MPTLSPKIVRLQLYYVICSVKNENVRKFANPSTALLGVAVQGGVLVALIGLEQPEAPFEY